MVQKKVLIHTSFLCLSLLLATAVRADGEPTEFVAGIQELRADERLETAEDAIATVTADGEFLLPSYLVPVEETLKTTEVITEERPVVPVGRKVKTTTVRTEYVPADATVLAQFGIPAPGAPVLLGAGSAKMPAPASSRPVPTSSQPALASSRPAAVKCVEPPKRTKPLLIPVAEKEIVVREEEEVLPVPNRPSLSSAYADRILADFDKNGAAAFMPQEMKVTFYPGEAAFSGQSLKWIKAFSRAAMYDPRLVLDIRMSQNNMPLQHKRLALLKNALTGAGLSTHQIQVSFVNRPTDTLLLRNIKRPEATELIQKKTQNKKEKQTKAMKW